MKHLSLKFALFVTLFFLPVIISGCWGCNCKPSPETYFDVKGLIGGLYDRNQTSRIPIGGGIYKVSDFYIGLFADMTYYGSLPTLCGGAGLQACDCEYNAGAKGSKELVKNITIVSNQDFATDYPAGTNIANYVRLSAYYQHIDSLYEIKIEDFLAKNLTAPPNMEIIFTQPSLNNKKHIFTIRYELDNGEVYTYTTPEITFQ
jgi:hypothetical protein